MILAIKILPVVEFRMTESVQNKNTTTNSATHFNFHIIFDDAIKSLTLKISSGQQAVEQKSVAIMMTNKIKR